MVDLTFVVVAKARRKNVCKETSTSERRSAPPRRFRLPADDDGIDRPDDDQSLCPTRGSIYGQPAPRRIGERDVRKRRLIYLVRESVR